MEVLPDDAPESIAITWRGAEVERYLRAETPYDCAGSAKIETLGIALVESVACDDPTALIGLPLIRTCALLRRAGIDPLGEPRAIVGA